MICFIIAYRRNAMAAYVVNIITVEEAEGLEEYRKLAGPVVARYGGRLGAAEPAPNANSRS